MAFDFDLEAAINQIATLEEVITTPTPGITNSYGYGLNVVEFGDGEKLPAINHVPLGPQTSADGEQPGRITYSAYNFSYTIQSFLIILEVVPSQYPADETASNLFWKSVSETFFNIDNRRTLATAANAHSYHCIFPARSYDIRAWPPLSTQYKLYWSLEYSHVFTFAGG